MSLEMQEGDALREEEVDLFQRDGLFVIDDPCPLELVDAVLSDIEPVLQDGSHAWRDRSDGGVRFTSYPSKRKGYHWSRIANAWVFCEAVRGLALHPRILSIIETLHGSRALPFQTLNFPLGTEQGVHFDSMAFESDPPGYMCGVWIALEDMDMDNGPLVYYPGSHKLASPSPDQIEYLLGERLDQREAFRDHQQYSQRRWAQYEQACQRLIELHNLEPHYATVKKGQAVVWAANLLHGGSPVRDHNRTRHSQVTHYFFEGCERVCTPVRTEGDHIFWDYPSWIRDPLPQYSTSLVHGAIRACVPAGAKLLIATTSEEDELLDVDGFDTCHFPGLQASWHLDPCGAERVRELERRRAEGAQYLVLPRAELSPLQNRFPELQEHLENHYRGILRDGWICAVYGLQMS